MFGIDFSELIIIMVIALIIVGPERLPKVARTLGHLWGRAQRYINGVKADISRDMAVEEFRQMQQKVQQEAHSADQAMRQVAQTVDQQVQQLNQAVTQPAKTIAKAVTDISPPSPPVSADSPKQTSPDSPPPTQHKPAAD